MRAVADRSSGYAYLFVVLNLVLLLAFFVSSSLSLREVESTRNTYHRLTRDWFALRLSVADPSSTMQPAEELSRFSTRLEVFLDSHVLAGAELLSEPLASGRRGVAAAWERLEPALRAAIVEPRAESAADPPVAERLAALVGGFEAELVDLEPILHEFVDLEQRALTILIVFLGATILASIAIFVLIEREHENHRRAAAGVRSFAQSTLGGLEQERSRIARALHDSLGQELAVALIEVGELSHRRSRDAVEQVAGRLRHAVDWVRDLAHELHPAEIDDVGLPEALRVYCEDRSATTAATVRCTVPERASAVPKRVAINVYRIAQEAITNALRHAEPERVDVVLELSAHELALTVADNGRGLPRGDRSRRPLEGIGMVGMRERASMIGARFEVSSAPGTGTRVRLIVPADTGEAAG